MSAARADTFIQEGYTKQRVQYMLGGCRSARCEAPEKTNGIYEFDEGGITIKHASTASSRKREYIKDESERRKKKCTIGERADLLSALLIKIACADVKISFLQNYQLIYYYIREATF